jgi:YHS domain-containing protein
MEALLYFAVWAGLVFLMMRFGCGRHMMGHGHGNSHSQASGGNAETDRDEPRWIAPREDVDPVCGTTVSTDKAKSSVFDGHVYYLCSRECREVFEAAPRTYVGDNQRRSMGQLEHSHV